MIAGGFDDISEEGSYEFANMKATSNAETEFAMGREPTEMSRPTTTTRAGVSSPCCIQPHSVLNHLIVYGIPGHRCTYRHECKNSPRVGCSYPWYPRLHLDLHVRIYLNLLENTIDIVV
jgi:hypothetical protein